MRTEFLQSMLLLHAAGVADAVYGVIRASLERTGQPIGANDLLIAAHALTLGHAVVTDNEREFLRIDDLRVENWLRADPESC